MNKRIIDEMELIVRCRQCGGFEYYGKLRWLNGKMECRSCYKHHYEEVHNKVYAWDDLDGKVPSEQEFLHQEDMICRNCNDLSCEGCEHQH